MLTPAAVKAARPQARAYKLFDSEGLFLFVAPTGLRSWRLKYQRAGREQLATLGRFPEMSLPEARAARDEAKARIRGGMKPAGQGSEAALDTFEQLARAWYADRHLRWSTAHAADVLASLEGDAFPVIGDWPAAAIGAPTVLKLLKAVERRGCLATAKRLRQRLSAIFTYGMVGNHCETNPAALLAPAMQPARPGRPQPALLTIEPCRQLLADCERTGGHAVVRLASRFLALTAVRLDAVRGMTWGEVEDLDTDEPIWRVPSARMKLSKVKKGEARFDHIVPLSAEAVAVLRTLVARRDHIGEANELVFRRGAKMVPIGEGAIRQLYIDAGYRGRHVPHGWRASFSTILNELMPEEQATIDRALAHSPKDKVEAAYNRAQQMARRRALFDRWGELLAG